MNKLILTTACALTLTASLAQAQIAIRIGPPRPVYERVPPPPPEHRDWAWHAGYHRWDGNRYIWTPGSYIEPPHAHARWVPGHWRNGPGGYVFVEGHWR